MLSFNLRARQSHSARPAGLSILLVPAARTLPALRALLAISMLAVVAPSFAQDTRQVTEPRIPPSCKVLHAELTAIDNKLTEEEESKSDTERLQLALNDCKQGMAVELRAVPERFGFLAHIGLKPIPERNAFLTAPIILPEGVTLLIDKGVTLYGSRNPKDYETTRGLCGMITDEAGGGCRPLIAVNSKNSAIMGDGVIDGRGDAELIGLDYSWWHMAREATPGNRHYNSSRLIVANHADGFILYRIALHNAPNYHVGVVNTNGFTAWGVHIQTPTVPGTDARNTDGIDPGSSTNITIAHSWIDNGDDNIAIKTGVTHMSVLDNHFYNGHGMSIGSDTISGDSNLLVDGLTLDHTTSGIRIKSNSTRGGVVKDLLYRNICMRNVQVPISISPFYDNKTIDAFVDPNIQGDRIPTYKRITLRNITALTPGDVLIAGKDAAHLTAVTLDNVNILGIKPEQVHAQFANITMGPLGANFTPTGNGVTVTAAAAAASGAKPAAGTANPKPASGASAAVGTTNTKPATAVSSAAPAAPYACDGKFPPMQ
ncbi:MAG: glycoside hydrolase family 28 protein [Acidobacteriaceae bacterium]